MYKQTTLKKGRITIIIDFGLPERDYSLYGTRWQIETAFRQIKIQQAKTRVIDPCLRIWMFAVACLIYTSWIYRHLPEGHNQIIPEI